MLPRQSTQGAPAIAIWFDIGRDIRFALRRLVRAWRFSAFAVITLAIGVGVTTASYSVVLAVAGRQPPVRDPDGLVFVTRAGVQKPYASARIAYRDFPSLERQQRSFSAISGWMRFPASLTTTGGNRLVDIEAITDDYFQALGIAPALGQFPAPANQTGASVIVLSESLWKADFGADPRVVGSVVRVAGRPATVVGIAPKGFHGLSSPWTFARKAWVPIDFGRAIRGNAEPAISSTERLTVVARMAADATIETAMADVGVVAIRLDSTDPEHAVSGPITDGGRRWAVVPFETAFTASMSDSAYAVLALPLVVLLVACSNLANLTLSRGVARSSDLATRLALGASRWRLVREQTAESAILAVTGGLAGLAIAEGLVTGLLGVLAAPLMALVPMFGMRWEVDATIFAAASLAVAVAVTLGGLVPAYLLTRTAVGRALAANASNTTVPRWRGRGNVIALQVGSSVCLFLLALVALGFIGNSRARREVGAAGLDRAALAFVPLTEQQYTDSQSLVALQAMTAAIRRMPGVEAVAAGTHLPLPLPWIPYPHTAIEANSSSNLNDAARLDAARLYGVTVGSTDALGWQLRSGRPLVADDERPGASSIVVLSNPLAERLFGSANQAVGRTFHWRHGRVAIGSDTVRTAIIAGVIEAPAGNVGEELVAFTPVSQTYLPVVTLAVWSSSGNGATLVRPLEAAIARADPSLAVAAIGRADTLAGAPMVVARVVMTAATVLAVAALALSMTGLYGVLSQIIALRLREMGLRIALGATKRDILALVARGGLRPVVEGAFIGIAGAFAARQLIQWSTPETIPPLTLWACLQVVVPLGFVAALTCLAVSARATAADPSVLLKDS